MPVGPSGASDSGPDAALIGTLRLGFSESGGLRVGVAVSGGGDSMALLHLMHRTALGANCTLFAVTVDHALRLDSAAEARDVAGFCQTLGVHHTTLRWDHGAVSGNLMDAARQARMRLMSDWAAGMGIAHIALGHTADDQAETFLMGLGRASAVWPKAICAMPMPAAQSDIKRRRACLAASIRLPLTLPWSQRNVVCGTPNV